MLMADVLGTLNEFLVKAGGLSLPKLTNAEADMPDDSAVMLHPMFCPDVLIVLEHMFTSAVKSRLKHVFPIEPAAAMTDSVQGAPHLKISPESKKEVVLPC